MRINKILGLVYALMWGCESKFLPFMVNLMAGVSVIK